MNWSVDCLDVYSFESKGTQFVKSLPTYPIGLPPDDVAKREQAKKVGSEPAATAASAQHMSKAAKKNAKRKEKKKQEQAGGGVAEVTKAVGKVSVTEPKDGTDTQADLAKKVKNLKKKLKQIEDLEAKIQSGELKNPEKDQLEKVARKHTIVSEIEDLELELEDSWPDSHSAR